MAHRLTDWLAIFAVIVAVATASPACAAEAPSPPREFRAAWIATVANIDWPSKPGLSTRQQKQELIRLFDKAVELNLNAVIFQIRPAADALYQSKIEPWSEYLTGEQGQPPKPFYDPLKFAVEEAHRRGLHLHVWFNPYRVRQSGGSREHSPDHVSQTNPEIVREYGPYLWFDPGEPEAVKRFIDVITDVVRRYDIDGVHIDDYFYPYPVEGKPFPDDESYERAVAAGETLGRDDWRRQNCDRLVEQMYGAVKAEKPWVLVGISPFGIWRPGHPEGIQGLDQYAVLYADARKWLREGWVDYFTPQLYWQIEGPQSYPKLLSWWSEQNVKSRHLWPGNGAHNVRRSADVEPARNAWPAEELINQIKLTREIVEHPGNVHFSMKCLIDNRDGLTEKLKSGVYAEQAIIPEIGWLGGEAPGEPTLSANPNNKGFALKFATRGGAKPWQWIVRVREGDQWKTHVLPGAKPELSVETGRGQHKQVVASAVSRLGLEGPQATFDLQKPK
ncbi:MAG TPA: family 10 glycosylhydrolase [Lacipirellula sp.]